MITIHVKGTAELGEKLCKALVGNQAFIENDIVVNYDNPEHICILLGDPNEHDVTLKAEAE